MTAAPVAPSFTDLERERLARIALTQLIEPGTPLLDPCMVGSTATEVYRRFAAEDPDLGDDGLEARLRLAQIHPDRDLERAANAGFRYVIPGDEEWPTQVERLAGQEPLQYRTGTPLGLWVRGRSCSATSTGRSRSSGPETRRPTAPTPRRGSRPTSRSTTS